MKKYPNDHTAIVGMVNEYGFAEVVRALAEQASRRRISHRDNSMRQVEAILADTANAIEAATN